MYVLHFPGKDSAENQSSAGIHGLAKKLCVVAKDVRKNIDKQEVCGSPGQSLLQVGPPEFDTALHPAKLFIVQADTDRVRVDVESVNVRETDLAGGNGEDTRATAGVDDTGTCSERLYAAIWTFAALSRSLHN